MANNPELHDALMDQYARDQGHEPTDSWILIVHEDGTSDYFPFDEPIGMWCCSLGPLIRRALAGERSKKLREQSLSTSGQDAKDQSA